MSTINILYENHQAQKTLNLKKTLIVLSFLIKVKLTNVFSK